MSDVILSVGQWNLYFMVQWLHLKHFFMDLQYTWVHGWVDTVSVPYYIVSLCGLYLMVQ